MNTHCSLKTTMRRAPRESLRALWALASIAYALQAEQPPPCPPEVLSQVALTWARTVVAHHLRRNEVNRAGLGNIAVWLELDLEELVEAVLDLVQTHFQTELRPKVA